jgi:lipase chaperone LimK
MRVIGMESQQLLDEEEEKQAIGIGKQAIWEQFDLRDERVVRAIPSSPRQFEMRAWA